MLNKFLIIILVLNVFGCKENIEQSKLSYYPNNYPSDFNFKINISNGFSYQYDSKSSKIEKLISFEGRTSDTLIVLSKIEKEFIWGKIKETDILRYPKNYEPENNGVYMTPSPSYQLEIYFDGTTKEIIWSQNTSTFSTFEAQKLEDLILGIDSILISKSEFKSLPEQTWVLE